jgi:hypothetical protein
MLVTEQLPSRWFVNGATQPLSQTFYKLLRDYRSTLCKIEARVSCLAGILERLFSKRRGPADDEGRDDIARRG